MIEKMESELGRERIEIGKKKIGIKKEKKCNVGKIV